MNTRLFQKSQIMFSMRIFLVGIMLAPTLSCGAAGSSTQALRAAVLQGESKEQKNIIAALESQSDTKRLAATTLSLAASLHTRPSMLQCLPFSCYNKIREYLVGTHKVSICEPVLMPIPQKYVDPLFDNRIPLEPLFAGPAINKTDIMHPLYGMLKIEGTNVILKPDHPVDASLQEQEGSVKRERISEWDLRIEGHPFIQTISKAYFINAKKYCVVEAEIIEHTRRLIIFIILDVATGHPVRIHNRFSIYYHSYKREQYDPGSTIDGLPIACSKDGRFILTSERAVVDLYDKNIWHLGSPRLVRGTALPLYYCPQSSSLWLYVTKEALGLIDYNKGTVVLNFSMPYAHTSYSVEGFCAQVCAVCKKKDISVCHCSGSKTLLPKLLIQSSLGNFLLRGVQPRGVPLLIIEGCLALSFPEDHLSLDSIRWKNIVNNSKVFDKEIAELRARYPLLAQAVVNLLMSELRRVDSFIGEIAYDSTSTWRQALEILDNIHAAGLEDHLVDRMIHYYRRCDDCRSLEDIDSHLRGLCDNKISSQLLDRLLSRLQGSLSLPRTSKETKAVAQLCILDRALDFSETRTARTLLLVCILAYILYYQYSV